MQTESLRELVVASVFSACAIVMVLALRNALRALFGPTVAYKAWLLVPTVLVAVIVPVHEATPTYLAFIGSALPLSRYVDTLIVPSGTLAVAVFLSSWAAGTCSTLLVLLWHQARFVRSLGMVVRSDGIHYAQHDLCGPCVLGILHPRIVVPLDFEDRYTPAEQQVVLAHERTHVRRGDPIANAICAFLRSVFWFNPLVHFAASRFRFDQELACDEAVIRRDPTCQRLYANAMLKTHAARAQLPLACHWPSRHPLKARIMMLKGPTLSGSRRALGSMLTGLAVVAIGYGVWAVQPGQAEDDRPSGDVSSPGVMRDDRRAPLAQADANAGLWTHLSDCRENVVFRGGVDDVALNYARREVEAWVSRTTRRKCA